MPAGDTATIFKAEAARACGRPGVSVAAVALARSVNANLLRRGVQQHRASSSTVAASLTDVPAFIPLTLPALTPQLAAGAAIRIELKRGAATVNGAHLNDKAIPDHSQAA